MAISVVIVEDEQPAARRLKRMLEALDTEVVALLHSVKEAVNWFTENTHPKLIFLDIQLSDGLSFEIFDKIAIKSAIIFTTAYDEYALKAFKFNSIDYLLKPIDNDELKHALYQFKQRETTLQSPLQFNLEHLKQLLVNPLDRQFKKRFTIKIGQRLKIIPVADIVCFYSEDKASYLHTIDNRSYLLDNTLEQLENQLDPLKYFRVNRAFIVSLEAIKDIIAYTNNRLKIDLKAYDKNTIIVSREKVKAFKQWLG
jgi:two-component system, LytTR family, response regulator